MLKKNKPHQEVVRPSPMRRMAHRDWVCQGNLAATVLGLREA